MYDVIGAGIGPFNLGLAALLEDIPGTDALFSIKERICVASRSIN